MPSTQLEGDMQIFTLFRYTQAVLACNVTDHLGRMYHCHWNESVELLTILSNEKAATIYVYTPIVQ